MQFYENLPNEIKRKLKKEDLFQLDFDNHHYYSFFDLGDGNCLAVDEYLIVYSLVHDARPVVQRLGWPFEEILTNIKAGKFDSQAHLDERYGR